MNEMEALLNSFKHCLEEMGRQNKKDMTGQDRTRQYLSSIVQDRPSSFYNTVWVRQHIFNVWIIIIMPFQNMFYFRNTKTSLRFSKTERDPSLNYNSILIDCTKHCFD